MYDVFIDEEKNKGYIGFLFTRNTPALQQLLYNVREYNQNYQREIKFVNLNNNSIRLALSWLNIFFSNSYNAFFLYKKWDGSLSNKKNLIIKVLKSFKVKTRKSNLVAFMDFDNNHKNLNLQNQIKSSAKITRCYHIDSKCFDMLQLCDVLLQCSIKMESISLDKGKYMNFIRRVNRGNNIEKSNLKKLIVFHSIIKNRLKPKIRNKLIF